MTTTPTPATAMTGRYCIVRCRDAGVFAGTIAQRHGDEALLHDARRIWYWDGAASLSQLATEGTSRPSECKFTVPVPETVALGVIEIIPITDTARDSIASVKPWRA